MQTQQDLVYSYIINTKFYDYLRYQLSGNLMAQQLKQLVQGIETVIRYKPQNIFCTFDQPVFVIIIYGEVHFRDKNWQKGEYFQVKEIEKLIQADQNFQVQRQKMNIKFLKSTTLLLLNLEILEFRVQQILKIRQKVKIIEKCTPIKQLKLSIGEVRKIAKIMQIRRIEQKYTFLPKEAGFYIFFQGIFQLCHQNIPALELQNSFVQITQKIQFTIRLKNISGSYGFIIRQQLYQLLEPQVTLQLQKLWKFTQQAKKFTENKKKYIESAQQLRQRIRKRMRQTKKFSLTQKQKNQTSYQQSLASSRRNMLQKCSTFSNFASTIPSNKSGSPQKTARSNKKTQSLYSVNWTGFKQKSNINLGLSQEKLQKMRNFSNRKAKTKLQKEWYHLESEKMSTSLNLSYFQIKNIQSNKQQAAKLCNYKRVHRIYSDPCFKKTQTFRFL